MHTAVLALGDGSLFRGRAIGVAGEAVGEVVFNTAMTGYQEILTDPSYRRQLVTLTYPHIGNTGINDQDLESQGVMASGLIVRDVPPVYSNYRACRSLPDYLRDNGVVGISDIDTRRLVRILRETGAQSGCIITGDNPDEAVALERARAFPGMEGLDLTGEVTADAPYEWTQGIWEHARNEYVEVDSPESLPYHVVAYDFGMKRNILRLLVDRGCRVTVMPGGTSADEVLARNPDGVFLSNGPGDPDACQGAKQEIMTLLESRVPIFGICLGQQLMALGAGARTVKMKFGHHGANHPVLDEDSGQVKISSQNHGFAAEEATLPGNLRATHRSLFDGSLQGIEFTDRPAFAFQGHPEASPGPHDMRTLFDRFIGLIEARRAGRA